MKLIKCLVRSFTRRSGKDFDTKQMTEDIYKILGNAAKDISAELNDEIDNRYQVEVSFELSEDFNDSARFKVEIDNDKD